MADLSTETIVREVVARFFRRDAATVDLDQSIEEGTDSLELSGLIVALEERFGIALPDSAIGRLRVLRDLVTLVEEQRAAAAR
jgi:acyl carrier protein